MTAAIQTLRRVTGASEMRSVVTLALPVVVVQLGLMLMGVVDVIMVGRVSATALAAVALGHVYYFGIIVFGIGTLMALDPVIAQAVGAGDEPGIGRGIQRGLVLAAALAVLVSLVMLPARPAFAFFRQPADVVPIGAGYVRALIAGNFPFLAFVVLRQSLQAMDRVRPIVAAIVVGNLANAVLNWVLIFGNLGAPPMGAVGSGWASSICRWIMALALLGFAWPVLRGRLWPVRAEVLRRAPLGRMIRLGAPIGLYHQLEVGAFAIVALLMGVLGTIQMAAHQVAINLASLTFMVPLGVGTAAAVRVGQAIGRQRPIAASAAATAALVLGAGFMAATAGLFLLAPDALAAIYTDDGRVLALAALLIPVAGVFQVFDGLQAVAVGVLRGIGDTRAPLIINLTAFWLIGLPVSIYLGFYTEAGPVGLWWGLVAGLAAVAFLLLIRVRRRFRGEIRRIRIDADEPTDGPDEPGAKAGTGSGRD